jgi:murein DD-endopeptidase MepM/ murein hydrolase activator NlpD
LRPPERELILRERGTVRYVRLSPSRQMTIGAIGLAACVVVAAGVIAFVMRGYDLARVTNEVADSRAARQLLIGALGDYRERFRVVSQNLDDGSLELGVLEQRSRSVRATVLAAKLTSGAQSSVAALHDAALRQLDTLESTLSNLSHRGADLRMELAELHSQIESAALEAPSSEDRQEALVVKVKALERQVASLEASEGELVKKLAESTAGNIGEAERTIRRVGLNADQLIDAVKGRSGVGGPFVAFRPDLLRQLGVDPARMNLDQNWGRWTTLRGVLRNLPLGAPMLTYEMVSTFGHRSDPFNGRAAMHNGLDLTGPPGSPIYATAPGIVRFVGWRDRYGKMVEIDHGMGIRTRYGHLHAFNVGEGQIVSPGDQVGEMGSTGRSTGAHLHYEVLFNDEPQDPMKFIQAGVRVLKN